MVSCIRMLEAGGAATKEGEGNQSQRKMALNNNQDLPMGVEGRVSADCRIAMVRFQLCY